jgi:hypothetical protein
MSGTPMVEYRDLHKRFDRPILAGVNLRVGRGGDDRRWWGTPARERACCSRPPSG